MVSAIPASALQGMFAELEDDCRCLRDPQWQPADVKNIIRWHARDKRHDVVIIVELTSDGYGLLTESSDYSGHNGYGMCQSMTVREPTLARLLSHLTDFELAELLTTP